METVRLWARNGDAVRQAIELGELVPLETAYARRKSGDVLRSAAVLGALG